MFVVSASEETRSRDSIRLKLDNSGGDVGAQSGSGALVWVSAAAGSGQTSGMIRNLG